jgi:hypothetical protein
MIKRFPLYHSDLFVLENVGTDEQVTELVKQIKTEKQLSPATDFTNKGCWRSMKWWDNTDWLCQAVCTLASTASSHYKELDPNFELGSKFKLGMWTNVNDPTSRNVMHNHVRDIFAAVYYIQGEDTGALRLVNGSNVMQDLNPSAPFSRDFRFAPKNRSLILWPAWVPHEVDTNISNKQRINIAFNVNFDTDA